MFWFFSTFRANFGEQYNVKRFWFCDIWYILWLSIDIIFLDHGLASIFLFAWYISASISSSPFLGQDLFLKQECVPVHWLWQIWFHFFPVCIWVFLPICVAFHSKRIDLFMQLGHRCHFCWPYIMWFLERSINPKNTVAVCLHLWHYCKSFFLFPVAGSLLMKKVLIIFNSVGLVFAKHFS